MYQVHDFTVVVGKPKISAELNKYAYIDLREAELGYFLSDYCESVENKEGLIDLLAYNAIFAIHMFDKLG